MPSPSTTNLLDEARLAAQGTVRVITFKRDAAIYFGADQRALVGSFLALVIAVALTLAVNALTVSMAESAPMVSSFETVVSTALIYLGQIGGTYLALRGGGRVDRFVPYVTADNWTSFYLSVLTAILGLVGLGGDVALVFVGIITIVAKINIARFVAELTGGGVAVLIVAQLVGAAVALLVIGAVFGPVSQPAS